MVLSKNQNQRYKGIKVKLGVKTWLALAFCVWMIYQLRVYLNHSKQSSGNGLSVKEEDQSEKLKLGRKGLILTESEAMEEDKGRKKTEALEEESEDLVEEADKGGDANDDDELEAVRFDDPMDEIDSLNDDDGDGDDSASTDQYGEEEDDSPLERENADTKLVPNFSEVKSRY